MPANETSRIARAVRCAAAVALLAAGGGCASRAPSPDTGPEGEVADGAVADGPVHGSSATYFRARRTDDATDIDLYETLSVDFGDESRDATTGHLMFYAAADLDGRSASDGEDADFLDVDDSHDTAIVGRLYDAWVDLNAVDGLAEARIGRQQMVDTPVLTWFDGAWIETEEAQQRDLALGLYGGVPVHMFESSREGDVLGGVYLSSRPWKGGRVRLDYLHLEDETRLGEERDDLYALRAWHNPSERLRLSAGHTRLESDSRDLFGRGDWYDPEDDLRVQVYYRELFQTQGDLPLEIDPFYSSLRSLFPYRTGSLVASKGLGDRWIVEAGVARRAMSDEQDEGQFNREWDRYHGTLTIAELRPGLEVTLTGEAYDDGGTTIEAWSADVSQELENGWEASVGSAYALYEYDVFLERERDHSRIWYLRVRQRGDRQTLDTRLDYEEDDLDDYLVLRLGMTWSF